MNRFESIAILRTIKGKPGVSTLDTINITGLSAQEVKAFINKNISNGLLSGDIDSLFLSDKGLDYLEQLKVDNAIVLAAGFGSRCVPLTYETPKGLLTIHGKPMLERQIEQLKESGVEEIIIVVGYLKEKFEYMIDKYGVKLVFNPEFSTKNNLTSLYYALPHLKNSYLLCADNWIENNIFNAYEADSWFSCLYMEGPTPEWSVKHAKDDRIQKIMIGGSDCWTIVGPAYFTQSFSNVFSKLIVDYYNKPGTEDYYWEHVLKDHISQLPIYMNRQTGNVHEFENVTELRSYDISYIDNSRNGIMETIASVHGVNEGEIHDIVSIKEGLTNKSFRFSIGEKQYVFRLPGTGTEKLINRANEKSVYDVIGPLGISDEIVFFDASSGIKISKYYENTRIADPFDDEDLKISMVQIKKIHQSGASAKHSFNIESMINYYYSLANEIDAVRFSDINEVLGKVRELFSLRKSLNIPEVLCHGDYAHTNVLLFDDNESKIIDWEFAGMSDPIMDVSMFAIFAQFDQARIDLSLRLYLDREPTGVEQSRLYLYVALGGFLWSMWSQYKQGLGQEFGTYPMIMYRYMKDYYKLLRDVLPLT